MTSSIRFFCKKIQKNPDFFRKISNPRHRNRVHRHFTSHHGFSGVSSRSAFFGHHLDWQLTLTFLEGNFCQKSGFFQKISNLSHETESTVILRHIAVSRHPHAPCPSRFPLLVPSHSGGKFLLATWSSVHGSLLVPSHSEGSLPP